MIESYLGISDSLIILQRVPGGYPPVFLSTGEERSFGQHNQRTDSLVVGLVLHPYEVGAVGVDAVYRYETVAVGRYDVSVLLELQRGD